MAPAQLSHESLGNLFGTFVAIYMFDIFCRYWTGITQVFQKEHPDGGDYVKVRWRDLDGYARRANVVKAMVRALHMGKGPDQNLEGFP